MSDCLFCRIARHEIPVTAVFEDARMIVFPDIHPQAPTHLLVIPKEHFAAVGEAPEDTLGNLLQAAAGVAAKELPAGYRIVINTGHDGGQTVGHLHLHVLGGRPMTWPPG